MAFPLATGLHSFKAQQQTPKTNELGSASKPNPTINEVSDLRYLTAGNMTSLIQSQTANQNNKRAGFGFQAESYYQ